MGCDIHLVTEVKSGKTWVPVPEVAYDHRNYSTFAMLAGVRNGIGFAGRPTGEGFKPISEPKMLPEDLHHKTRGQIADWNGDGHSHSFLTLEEILAYPVDDLSTVLFGVISVADYAEWSRNPPTYPKDHCGWITGKDVKVVEEVDYVPGSDATHIQVKWPVTYREAAPDFFNEFVPQLKVFADSGPENVRIVFWFDS